MQHATDNQRFGLAVYVDSTLLSSRIQHLAPVYADLMTMALWYTAHQLLNFKQKPCCLAKDS